MLTRCTALTTSKPVRLCSRNTVQNSAYCTQHSKIYEKGEKSEKIEEIEKIEKIEKIEEIEKIEKIDEVEKSEKMEKIEKIEESEKMDKSRILIDIVEKHYQEITQFFVAGLQTQNYVKILRATT